MMKNRSNISLLLYLLLFSCLGFLITIFSGLLLTFVANSGFVAHPVSESVWVMQIVIILQHVFVGLLPGYLIFKMISKTPMKSLGFVHTDQIYKQLFYVVLIYIASSPAVSVVSIWNNGIVFPEALAGLEAKFREMEQSATSMTDMFTSEKGIGDMAISLLIAGVLTAVAEEVFFRGVLQQILFRMFGNGHAAVWVTAIIFSSIHLQFYGFFTRVFMGAVMGYLFLYSRNLWVPIACHLVNNGSIVIMSFFWGDTEWFKGMGEEDLTWMAWIQLAASLIVTYVLFKRFKTIGLKEQSVEEISE